MKTVVLMSLTQLLCLVQALSTILSTSDPNCIVVEPMRIGGVIDFKYTVSGVKEENVEFSIMSGDKEITRILGSEGEHKFRINKTNDLDVCWVRTDRKIKKVTFMISQHG
mmetsp:Transcript_29612/g.36737  ORF Transcript_29612/g.36737 Transcript_29612/m.36737 type:complete len:110 (-) Transcript_29612:422-751(-)|eukprot:CAMPEP_0170465918 /NCGR_PEP_ID=MMETSP0123-20130129/10077_1 /TAXON_ID=182087 /ORGANISM="Favella ehrenbergii, Strain Fehren 1" /LENGTH=109 /DNA_ID=CAMNT_0010731925 /DNA_START=16 /DNA_END=345 /DNA_ORIENTATION=-